MEVGVELRSFSDSLRIQWSYNILSQAIGSYDNIPRHTWQPVTTQWLGNTGPDVCKTVVLLVLCNALLDCFNWIYKMIFQTGNKTVSTSFPLWNYSKDLFYITDKTAQEMGYVWILPRRALLFSITEICGQWRQWSVFSGKQKRKLEHFKGLVIEQAYKPLITPVCYKKEKKKKRRKKKVLLWSRTMKIIAEGQEQRNEETMRRKKESDRQKRRHASILKLMCVIWRDRVVGLVLLCADLDCGALGHITLI